MKLSQAKEYLPFVQAAAEGKMIQSRLLSGNGWMTHDPEGNTEFSEPPENYRIKPEPRLRAWKPEEVPVGALLKSESGHQEFIIMGRRGSWPGAVEISAVNTVRGGWQNFDTRGCTYSTDNGKTWKPCGILENQE